MSNQSYWYKIFGNILVNLISLVIGDLVSIQQSTFVLGCQILDGSMIKNKVISRCKAKKGYGI